MVLCGRDGEEVVTVSPAEVPRCWCGLRLVPSASPLDREGALLCPRYRGDLGERDHDTYVDPELAEATSRDCQEQS